MLQDIATTGFGVQLEYLLSTNSVSITEVEMSPSQSHIENMYGIPNNVLFVVPSNLYILPDNINTIPFLETEIPQTMPEGGSAPLNITYRNPGAVQAFLTAHPQISRFVEDATPFLLKYFGQPLEIVLEVMTYAYEGSYDELVGWIQSSDNIEDGLDKLEQFEDEWFLDHLAQVDNLFNFNLEFK